MRLKKYIKVSIITLATLLILLIMCIAFFMDFFLIYPSADDYIDETFSVVINNTTDETVNDVAVLYGGFRDDTTGETPDAFLFATIDSIAPNRYTKVIIPTDDPSEDAGTPYNVFVSMEYNRKKVTKAMGYFGIKTGGFAAVEVIKTEDGIALKNLPKTSRKYHRLYWKHRRKQWELSW